MSAPKKTKDRTVSVKQDGHPWPAAWGEPSKEECPVPAPKWQNWIGTRRVTLENAILLSLNYDPKFFKGESIAHLLENDPAKEHFDERLDMLRDCHTEATVLLSDFASRAVTEFKWEGLPDKLKEQATEPTGAPETKNDAAAGDARFEKKDTPWVAQARRLALDHIAFHKQENLYPSQKDVCAHVAKKMREQKIYGPHARPLEENYIQRNAIQGKWWQDNKP